MEVPPGLEENDCKRRQELTIQNALYALQHNSNDKMFLYGSLQCWDETSARYCARTYAEAGFRGIAIGGMVPRARDPIYVRTIVNAVREEAPDTFIHVFGIGNTNLIPELIKAGADSFDSRSYARNVINKSDSGSLGLHSGLYAALSNLITINSAVQGKNVSIQEIMPNITLMRGLKQRRWNHE